MSENKRGLLWVSMFLVAAASVFLVMMGGLGSWYMPGMMGMMGPGWGLIVLAPIVLLVFVVFGAYYLVTWSTGTRGAASNRGGRALEILKERYARSELTKEQFLTMKKELEQ